MRPFWNDWASRGDFWSWGRAGRLWRKSLGGFRRVFGVLSVLIVLIVLWVVLVCGFRFFRSFLDI